jgi:hypothetical protein
MRGLGITQRGTENTQSYTEVELQETIDVHVIIYLIFFPPYEICVKKIEE